MQTLVKDLLLNPLQYNPIFDSRQIYLMKEDSKALAACRPITIQSSVLKIVENITLDYYRKLKDEGKVKTLDVSQCGFQAARSTQINICRVVGIIQQTV